MVDTERELLKGNTPTRVLAVLKDAPLHGYGIAREIERRSGNAPDMAAHQPLAEASAPALTRQVVSIEHQDSQGTRQQSTSDVLGTSSGRREE